MTLWVVLVSLLLGAAGSIVAAFMYESVRCMRLRAQACRLCGEWKSHAPSKADPRTYEQDKGTTWFEKERWGDWFWRPTHLGYRGEHSDGAEGVRKLSGYLTLDPVCLERGVLVWSYENEDEFGVHDIVVDTGGIRVLSRNRPTYGDNWLRRAGCR